jgi:8-oxo-dGTP pyrophosphatase MutT (NUDIX family)
MPHAYDVIATRERFSGNVITVVSDDVVMPGGEHATRDYVRHPGAVGVVALDERGRVLLIRQYRHPVREVLWEVPAGLLDVDGEEPLAAAQRELAEEGHLRAGRWDLLVDAYSSPGMSDEVIRVFLARELSDVAEGDRYEASGDEEVELERHWVDLAAAVRMALAGEVLNAMCTISLLATAQARAEGWAPLRSPDTPWPAAGRGA